MPSDLEFYNYQSSLFEDEEMTDAKKKKDHVDQNDESLYYNAKNSHSLELFGEIISKPCNHNIWVIKSCYQMLKLLLSKSFNSSLLIDNPSYEEDDISLICHIIGNCIQQNSDWPVNSKMKARKAILKLISLYSDNRFLMENLFAIIDPIEQKLYTECVLKLAAITNDVSILDNIELTSPVQEFEYSLIQMNSRLIMFDENIHNYNHEFHHDSHDFYHDIDSSVYKIIKFYSKGTKINLIGHPKLMAKWKMSVGRMYLNYQENYEKAGRNFHDSYMLYDDLGIEYENEKINALKYFIICNKLICINTLLNSSFNSLSLSSTPLASSPISFDEEINFWDASELAPMKNHLEIVKFISDIQQIQPTLQNEIDNQNENCFTPWIKRIIHSRRLHLLAREINEKLEISIFTFDRLIMILSRKGEEKLQESIEMQDHTENSLISDIKFDINFHSNIKFHNETNEKIDNFNINKIEMTISLLLQELIANNLIKGRINLIQKTFTRIQDNIDQREKCLIAARKLQSILKTSFNQISQESI